MILYQREQQDFNYKITKQLPFLYLLYLCVVWSCTTTVFAQNPAPTYQHFTLEDGLPSLQTYNIIQDEYGFIWIATAMGVSRFDGKQFTNFSTANGLPDNNIWQIAADTVQHRLYFLQLDTLAYLHNKLSKIGQPNILPFQQKKPVQNLNFGDIIIDYKASITSTFKNIIPNQNQHFRQAISCQLPEQNGNNIWLGTWGAGAFFCQNYQDIDDIQVQVFLPKKIITDILKDREGNLWFATLDEGIFLLKNPNILTFYSKNNDLQSLAKDKNNNIWAGSSKTTLIKINQNTEIETFSKQEKSDNYNRINDLIIDQNNNKWLATDEGLQRVDSLNNWVLIDVAAAKSVLQIDTNRIWVGRYHQPVLLDTYEGLFTDTILLRQVSSLCKSKNKRLWIGSTQGLYHQKTNNDTLFFWGNRNESLSKHITDLKIDEQERLWIATEGKGLLVKKADTLLSFNTENGLASNIIYRLFLDKNNNVWVATNKGLNKINIKNFKEQVFDIKTFTHLDGLASSHINDILVNGDTVWVATSKGLSFFQQSKLKSNFRPPPIYFTNIQIAYRDTLLKNKYRLNHQQNNIRIEFVGLSYQSGATVHYQYQMRGIDTTWQSTNTNFVSYPALPSGSYEFGVRALDKNNKISRQSAKVRFHIALPFWETWWFLLLMALLTLLLLGLVGTVIIRYFKERNELQKRMIESEQMALRAQMNPHFIFNSLNSIQYFITENDKRSANRYLSVFSELMRKVLDNSQKSSILLEDELDYLRLYLEIEALRFKDKFEYKITLSETVKEDMYEVAVPPMLIQPYIENAIRHGLLQKKTGKRFLAINFEQNNEEDIIVCTIEDNGIGRAAAMKLQQGRPEAAHKGIGTTNPKERLAILNQLYHNTKIKVTISDLFDAKRKDFSAENQEKAHSENWDTEEIFVGTKVEIRIPIL